jgi:hypothetical protein
VTKQSKAIAARRAALASSNGSVPYSQKWWDELTAGRMEKAGNFGKEAMVLSEIGFRAAIVELIGRMRQAQNEKSSEPR